jgi:hypothetical protein
VTVIHEGTANLDSSLREQDFEPSQEFRSKSSYLQSRAVRTMYRRSVEQPESSGARQPPNSNGLLRGRVYLSSCQWIRLCAKWFTAAQAEYLAQLR